MQVIEAKLLIPGRGQPVENARVVLDGPVITYAGPAAEAPRHEGATVTEVPVVLPGLWDCHVHLFGLTTASLADVLNLPLPVAAARAVSDLSAALQAGYTSVREMGGLGVYLAQVVEEGIIDGPHVYGAGAVLSPTGGHADVHGVPISWVHDFTAHGGYLHLCDGVPECLKGVRSQLRLGAKLIKICASGGVLSEVDDPVHQQFSDEEMRAIVEEAARADRIVAAHCHGKPGMMAAVRAGVRTIEHGTYLDDEAAALMKDRGAIFVTTHFITERVLEIGERLGMATHALRKMEAVAAQQQQATRLAIKAGLTMAAGTDILSTGPETMTPWGMHGHELGHLVSAGQTPLEAIETATANAPLTLGPQAPKSGMVRAGYDADVIAVANSPLDDIAVLAEPDQIIFVWKDGKLVKDAPGG